MTTIAFRRTPTGCVLASDSRICDEHGMQIKLVSKIFKLKNGAWIGKAGDDDQRELIALLEKARRPSELPTRKQIAATQECSTIIMVWPSGKVFFIENELDEDTAVWDGLVTETNEEFCATGTGGQFAYGAMEMGATAVQAVEVGIRRDTASGGACHHVEITFKKGRK